MIITGKVYLSMIRFNVPPYVGGEMKNVEKAIENMHICGDGEFTKKCSEYLDRHSQMPSHHILHPCAGNGGAFV